jgi:hypothetical protein
MVDGNGELVGKNLQQQSFYVCIYYLRVSLTREPYIDDILRNIGKRHASNQRRGSHSPE